MTGRVQTSTEGQFVGREENRFHGAARAERVHHQDNLRVEGKFQGREQKHTWTKAEKAAQVKQRDNLHQSGDFYANRKTWASAGEKASVIRHTDNLKMEGGFEGRSLEQVLAKGQKSETKRHTDNLKIEGTFTGKHSSGL